MMKKLCVLGSINVDLVAKTPRFPTPGETIIGGDFNTFPGGKGANQAVAAGKLGAPVRMLGMVGGDEFGSMMLDALGEAGVDTEAVERVDAATGVACIQVSAEGQNSIVVCPGANSKVDRAYVDRRMALIEDSDILMLQLEIPIDTVCYAIDRAFELGKTIILDPAPAVVLPEATLSKASIITPNETELRILTGLMGGSHGALEGCRALAKMGCKRVINKSGGDGAYLFDGSGLTLCRAYKVNAVDTTAAGDSFNAGLACALARGMELKESIIFANAAGGIATTQIGAQSAMPTWAECERFLKSAGHY